MAVKNKAIRDSLSLKITKLIVFVVFFIYALTLLFPFVWMFYNTFKSVSEYEASSFGFPTNIFNLGRNFLIAVNMEVSHNNIMTMVLRSLIVTVTCVAASMISSLTISYAIAKFKFPGRGLMYSVIIVIMLIPTVGTTAATYKLISSMGLLNNYLALILLSSGGLGFQFLMLHGVFKSISWSYAEAAMIDGASDFKIFRTVMIPLAAPTIAPLLIMNVIGVWNDYFTPFLYMHDKPTLAVGLNEFVTETMSQTHNYPALFMLMILSMLPIIVIFILFQKQIMSNVTTGGLK